MVIIVFCDAASRQKLGISLQNKESQKLMYQKHLLQKVSS
jgi:hypothetical protein